MCLIIKVLEKVRGRDARSGERMGTRHEEVQFMVTRGKTNGLVLAGLSVGQGLLDSIVTNKESILVVCFSVTWL